MQTITHDEKLVRILKIIERDKTASKETFEIVSLMLSDMEYRTSVFSIITVVCRHEPVFLETIISVMIS